MRTVLDIINIAKVSEYLFLNSNQLKGLYSGGVDIELPYKIYNIRRSVEWAYKNHPQAPTTEQKKSLNKSANYLYNLCAAMSLKAEKIIIHPVPPPISQASNLSAVPFSNQEIDLTWTPAIFPSPNLAVGGYILLRAEDPNLPVFTATNGQAPSCDANTTIVYDDIDVCKSLADATGLSPLTTYNFLLIPFTWDGTHPETYNYLTAGAPTATGTSTNFAPCILINPTATGITYPGTFGAGYVDVTLGATITSDGGDPVVYRGTLWSLGHPVGISDGLSVEGGTTIGTFSELRTDIESNGSCLLTNLVSGTKVYYRAYATNSGSIAMSPEAYFIVP